MSSFILIFILILILAIMIIGITIYKNISRKVKSFSRTVFGTTDILNGLKQVEIEQSSRPISISGGNALYLPKIIKDFPDYHKDTMEEKIKRFMLVYFESLEKKDFKLLNSVDVTETVKEILKSQVSDLLSKKESLTYDNIKIHALSVSGYTKTKELSTVKYQISLEYIDKSSKKVQVKYEVDITYLFEDMGIESFSFRCTHCGASLNESSTSCEYCGTLIVRNIDKIWRISNMRKLTQVG